MAIANPSLIRGMYRSLLSRSQKLESQLQQTRENMRQYELSKDNGENKHSCPMLRDHLPTIQDGHLQDIVRKEFRSPLNIGDQQEIKQRINTGFQVLLYLVLTSDQFRPFGKSTKELKCLQHIRLFHLVMR